MSKAANREAAIEAALGQRGAVSVEVKPDPERAPAKRTADDIRAAIVRAEAGMREAERRHSAEVSEFWAPHLAALRDELRGVDNGG